MTRRALETVLLTLITVALGGCGASSEPKVAGDGGADGGTTSSFASADIRGACGPADGPALRIRLYDEGSDCSPDTSARNLSFYLFGGVPVDPPATLSISTGLEADGSASWCPGGAAPCESASGGSITLESIVEGESASGHYDLDFASGRSESGSFEAVWCDSGPILCG